MTETQAPPENEPTKTGKIIQTKSLIKRGRKPAAPNEHYIDQKQFTFAILEFYANGSHEHYCYQCLDKIAAGLSSSRSFSDYTWKEDMIGDAKIKMYKAFIERKYKHKEQSIDPDTGEIIQARNPFSYFNMIAHRAFIARIKKENRITSAHERYKDHYYDEFISEQMDEVFQSKHNINLNDCDND